jgi:hypothetical protein
VLLNCAITNALIIRHHGEVLDDVHRHARPQKLFAPARERHVAIADRPAQRLGEHARVVLQVIWDLTRAGAH